MKIPVQFLQAEGEFSVPGTRCTVNSSMVRQAVGRLSLRDRNAALNYMVKGTPPPDHLAESLRQLIFELVDEQNERDTPLGASRSPR
jgi:hypothetical protein